MGIAGILSRLTGLTKKAESKGSPPLSAREGMQIHEVAVAGTQHEGRAEIARQLSLEAQLTLRRDRDNKYDENAVHVLNSADEALGYLPRRYAEALAPHLDSGRLNVESKIVRLEQDPAGKTHTVHIAICLPDGIMESPASPQLEYICDRGSCGGLYILLNCEPVMLNEIETSLTAHGITQKRKGPCIQRGSDGHKYNWFIRLEDGIEDGQVNAFFRDNYDRQPWNAEQPEDLADYVETFDTEIETKEEEIARLKDELNQSNEQLRVKEKNYKVEVAKTRRETVQAMFPNVELIRDSWDILFKELQNPEPALLILQKIQISPETVHAERVETTKCWMELHYATGLSNIGRLYFKRNGQSAQVLLSFKRDQSKDVKWMKKNS